MARRTRLEGRVLAILDLQRNRRALTRLGILLAALLFAGVAIPISILKATDLSPATDRKQLTRKHPAFVVFINNRRYGPTNGSSLVPKEGGVTPETGKSTCGHPGAVSEVEWKYLGTADGGDEYEVTRRFPADGPTPGTEKKTVVYAGKPLTVFEDDVQRILFLSTEDFRNIQERKATSSATQPALSSGPSDSTVLAAATTKLLAKFVADETARTGQAPPGAKDSSFRAKFFDETRRIYPHVLQTSEAEEAAFREGRFDDQTNRRAMEADIEAMKNVLHLRLAPFLRFLVEQFQAGKLSGAELEVARRFMDPKVEVMKPSAVQGASPGPAAPASKENPEPAGPAAAAGSLPGDAVELGKLAFEALGKKDVMPSLLAGGLTYDTLPVQIWNVNSLSVHLQHAYVDADDALLISSPLVWKDVQAEPFVVDLRASRTPQGWAIVSWETSGMGDARALNAFLREHGGTKHAYEAPPLSAPPGGRMFRIAILGADTGQPIEGVAIRALVSGKSYTLITDVVGTADVPLAGQASERLQLFIRHHGYVPVRYEPDDPAGAIPEGVALTLRPGRTIGGVVQNEDGEPVPNARVNAWPESPDMEAPGEILRYVVAITDEQGRWSVDGVPGDTKDVFVRLTQEDYVFERRWHDAGAMTGLWGHTNVLTLKRSDITVAGVVYGPDGKPIADARVSAGRSKFGVAYPKARTDANGQYEFKHSPPNEEMTLVVTAPGSAPGLTTIVAKAGLAPVDFHLAAGNTIRGRLVDKSGQPVAGVTVNVVTWRNTDALEWSTKTDAQGRFVWKDAPDDAVGFHGIKYGFVDFAFQLTASDEEQTVVATPSTQVLPQVIRQLIGVPSDGF